MFDGCERFDKETCVHREIFCHVVHLKRACETWPHAELRSKTRFVWNCFVCVRHVHSDPIYNSWMYMLHWYHINCGASFLQRTKSLKMSLQAVSSGSSTLPSKQTKQQQPIPVPPMKPPRHAPKNKRVWVRCLFTTPLICLRFIHEQVLNWIDQCLSHYHVGGNCEWTNRFLFMNLL